MIPLDPEAGRAVIKAHTRDRTLFSGELEPRKPKPPLHSPRGW